MNVDEYSLSDSFNGAGDSDGVVAKVAKVDDWTLKLIRDGARIIQLAIILVIIYLIYTFAMAPKGAVKDAAEATAEAFMPTSLMRMQQRDGTGERMSDRSQSVFAQSQEYSGGALIDDARARATPPGQPGSLAHQVLNSSDFGCKSRGDPSADDAWGWMTGVSRESMADRPKNDNELSRLLAGH